MIQFWLKKINVILKNSLKNVFSYIKTIALEFSNCPKHGVI
jgi:hypothetical protein